MSFIDQTPTFNGFPDILNMLFFRLSESRKCTFWSYKNVKLGRITARNRGKRSTQIPGERHKIMRLPDQFLLTL